MQTANLPSDQPGGQDLVFPPKGGHRVRTSPCPYRNSITPGCTPVLGRLRCTHGGAALWRRCTCTGWDLLLCSAASPIPPPAGERAVRDVSCTIPSLAFASVFKTGEGRLVGRFRRLCAPRGGKRWLPPCVLSQHTEGKANEAQMELSKMY